MKTIRLLFTFYRSIASFTGAVTLVCASIAFRWGAGTLSYLIWFKISTMIIAFWHVTVARKEYFYYYKNLGLSRLLLWATTLSADFLVFVGVLLIMLSLR